MDQDEIDKIDCLDLDSYSTFKEFTEYTDKKNGVISGKIITSTTEITSKDYL